MRIFLEVPLAFTHMYKEMYKKDANRKDSEYIYAPKAIRTNHFQANLYQGIIECHFRK